MQIGLSFPLPLRRLSWLLFLLVLSSIASFRQVPSIRLNLHRLFTKATKARSSQPPIASEVVYDLLCQASQKEGDFVYIDGKDSNGIGRERGSRGGGSGPYAASVKTILEGTKGQEQSTALARDITLVSSQLTDIETVRICCALGSIGVKAIHLENQLAWQCLEERVCSIDFCNLKEERDLHDEYLSSRGFDYNRSPALLSCPSPFMELLMGMTKMGVTWDKLTRATRYALQDALYHDLNRYSHLLGASNVNHDGRTHTNSDMKRLPRMTISTATDIQHHMSTSTRWTRNRTIFPLVSLLGLMKADYSQFSLELKQFFEKCLIMSLKSPPPFFSLANMILSLARMNMHVSNVHPDLRHTLITCISNNMHTVRRSVYWKLLAGISSLGFRWPSMDSKTRESVESPLQLFSMNVRVTSKEMSIVLNSLRTLGCDWHLLKPESQHGLLMAINESLQNYMSPRELSIIINSLGATSLTWKELPSDIQKQSQKAIYQTVSSMKSWDISQLMLGLGMMEAPTSLIIEGSPLEALIVSNVNLFGPITIPGLVQGISMMKKSDESSELGSEIKDALLQIVLKWSGKMTAMSLFDSLYALSLIFQCEISELPINVDATWHYREMFLFQADIPKNDLNKTLEDLKRTLPTIQPTNVPNTLFFCYKLGASVEMLDKAFLWNDLIQWIEIWAQRRLLKHEKITMLYNALEKIQANMNNVPRSTQFALLSVLKRELPSMDPRQVSNNLYYLGRMKFTPIDSLRKVSTLSFFSSCHLMESSEFANGFWALIEIFKIKKEDEDFNEKKLIHGFLQQRHIMNARDLSTLTTSLKNTGYNADTIPTCILEILYDAIVRVDMDATSISLLLFSLGGMKFEFKELPSVVKSTLRQAMNMFFAFYTPRELFWTIIGCSRMKIMWDTFSEESKQEFSIALAQNLKEPSMKRPSVMYILRAMTKISVTWEDLSPEARKVTECCTRLALRDRSTDDDLVIEFLTSISRMQIDGSLLQRRTRNAMFTRINRIDSEKLAPAKLLRVVQALVSLKFDVNSLPKGIVTYIREKMLQVFDGVKLENYMVIAFWRALRELKIRWSDLQSVDRECIANAALMILQKKSPSLLTSCVHELRHLGVYYDQLVAYCPALEIELEEALNVSLSKDISEASLIRSSHARKNEKLLQELTKFGKFDGEKTSLELESGTRTQQKQVSDQYKKLNHGMSNLSDQEIVRAVFMLGQRPSDRRIPVSNLVSNGTLRILDERLSKIFEESCTDLRCKISLKSSGSEKGILMPQGVTSGSTGVSSAGLIAVLVSLGKMGIMDYHLKISLDAIITYFTSISGNIDRRAFLAILRAFYSLGIKWDSFSPTHRLAFASGIAKAASTSPASRIPIILKCLVDLHVPWNFLHGNIPLVLRYIIFRLFTSVVTYDSTGSGIKVSRRAYLETIEYLAAMRATYNCLGSKASVAMLAAAETSLLADPTLCSRFIKAVGVVCEDAPPEFWRGLNQEVKVSLKRVFETAVYGILMSKPDSLFSGLDTKDEHESTKPHHEQVLVIDFKDSDRFLPFLTFMDLDIDSSLSGGDGKYEHTEKVRGNNVLKQKGKEDQEQVMYNNLINESGDDEPT